MNRRELTSVGSPFAMMAASSQAGAQSSSVTHAEAAPGDKPPLFPDNAQFWYETRRAFGAGSYGARSPLMFARRFALGRVLKFLAHPLLESRHVLGTAKEVLDQIVG